MLVFASLTGSSQKGGGYDVGSDPGGDHWPGSAWSQSVVSTRGLQSPGSSTQQNSENYPRDKDITILVTQEHAHLWLRPSQIEYTCVVLNILYSYNKLCHSWHSDSRWIEHDELLVRVTSMSFMSEGWSGYFWTHKPYMQSFCGMTQRQQSLWESFDTFTMRTVQSWGPECFCQHQNKEGR